MRQKKFVVIGGGTSGWITALSLRQFFAHAQITVIYSQDKGIVGVGEATTPHFVDFLKETGVDLADFMRSVGATLKKGISFENWNGDGQKYFHPFKETLREFSIPRIFGHTCFDFYLKKLIREQLPLDDYTYAARLAYANKVDVDHCHFAFHFDANQCAKYLENLARARGVQVVVGEFRQAVQDSAGNITQILTQDSAFECDFVFDCSGFHRAIIGGVYGQRWVSYREHLPMKQAITFWQDADPSFPPYTGCIAMKAGWMWRIPLQGRVGCGYVFDSDYIDADEAKREAEHFYGQRLDVRKVLKFDAGRYENIWVKNCIAVGLSGNFIEPLESTSIWLQLSLLLTLRQFLSNIDDLDSHSTALFNELIGQDVDEKMEFVYLHYLTKRQDSAFWRDFREKTVLPQRIARLLPFIKRGDLKFHNLRSADLPSHFALRSYVSVCAGLGLFEKPMAIEHLDTIEPAPAAYKAQIESQLQQSRSQAQFLEALGCPVAPGNTEMSTP